VSMPARFRAVFHSLGLRLLVPLLLIGVAVLAAYAWISFHSTREQIVELVTAQAGRCSELIRRSTHDGMLLNRKDEVQRTFERIAAGAEVAAVRIYNKRGEIFLSGQPEEIGTRPYELTAGPCRACHDAEGRRFPKDVGTMPSPSRILRGEGTLRHLSVIENEPGCTGAACHAHDPSQRVLGVLEVEMSLASVGEALRTTRWQLLVAAVALMAIIAAVSSVSIHHGVLHPVAQLHRGTLRIAGGDLDTRIDVPGHHELAQLARTFNRMAEDLATARAEADEWSHHLEEKVLEKTEDLRRTQRQVLQMERMASLGKLSATVAHELNNPLSGILMYARLVTRELGSQPLAEEVREELERYLDLIQRESQRCGTIVKNLLLFARRGGAEMAPVDLDEVVDHSLQLVRHHLEMHDVRLIHEPLDGTPEESGIVADAGQLEQALVALFVNAVEAMSGPGEKGGDLTVRMRGTDDEVVVEVGDTGVGISPEVLPHIFEPFFSTKTEESGVGLGLAVAYGIVERHGGTIEVESEPRHGTTFQLRLPRRPKLDNETGGRAPEPVTETSTTTRNDHDRHDL
jgi:two-component system NtrC family sensor kinase